MVNEVASDLTATLREALDRFGVPPDAMVAVAVSGGADSLALAHLMKGLRPLVTLTVDHGLRSEASAEAAAAGRQLAEAGIPHHILTWDGEKPLSNIQAAAREARYRLLADWCAAHGISFLATAHHQEDQAETLLLRLARGSGVYGLAGMAPVARYGGDKGLTLIRPLLDVPRAALREYLQAHAIPWAEDPSNRDPRFDRIKVRQFLEAPPLEGLSAQRLAETAKRLRRSRDALEFYESEWLTTWVTECEPGYLILEAAALDAGPADIVLRGLASLCRAFVPGAYTPRMEKVERLLASLRKEDSAQTLYGVLFSRSDNKILLVREAGACKAPVALEDGATWDNRFEISVSGDTRGLEIGALGEDGWRQAVTKWPEVRATSVPYMVRLSQPAIFHEGQLRALPQAGYSDLENVTVRLSRKPLVRPKKGQL